MKVLFLSVWYPSEKDKMMGLFVQKHAQAVAAQGAEVRVNTFWTGADIVQLNVLTLKKGLVAYILKKVWGIPYIIVEHWTGYMPENGQYEHFPRWKKRMLERIAREAEGIWTVSKMLENAMRNVGIKNDRFGQIDNIVDDCFREPYVKEKSDKIQLVHVCCYLERAKNVKGLLRVVKQIAEQRDDFHLTLIGNGNDYKECREYANQLGLTDETVSWKGELTPQEVCHQMQQSDIHILHSRYETYGIPLAEAISAGIPSIESDSCGLRLPHNCGISIPADDDEALAHAITCMLDHYKDYDTHAIRQEGKKYSSEIVGKELNTIYEQVCKR